MNRVVLAAFALLAGHGCAAVDETTTMADERRLMGTTMDDMDMTTSAATMMGTMADPEATTPMADTPSDVTSAAARSGGLGTMFLAILTFVLLGNAAGAAVDESTTMADERRLMGTTMDDTDMTTSAATMMGTMADSEATTPMADTPTDVTSAAARSGGLGTVLLALGLAVQS